MGKTITKIVRGECPYMDDEQEISVTYRSFMCIGSPAEIYRKIGYLCRYNTECPVIKSKVCPIYDAID